jgi:hypothetical protein
MPINVWFWPTLHATAAAITIYAASGIVHLAGHGSRRGAHNITWTRVCACIPVHIHMYYTYTCTVYTHVLYVHMFYAYTWSIHTHVLYIQANTEINPHTHTQLLILTNECTWLGLARTIYIYMRYFWQGNHQVYGHIRCIYGIFGREITKCTVIYGVYTVFLAGKSPSVRSYTVHIRYFWQGNHQGYGHIHCI